MSGPSVIDYVTSAVVQRAALPLKVLGFGLGDVGDAASIARALAHLMTTIREATLQSRLGVIREEALIQNIPCGTAGASVTIPHGLGRKPLGWIVTAWSGASGGESLVEVLTSRTSDVLVLNSYTAGTADVLVF